MNEYVLRHLKLKMEIRIKEINWCLSVQMMKNYSKNIKPFGQKLKTWKILNFLPVFDDRYIKTKIRTYGDKFYTNFHGLNLAEGDIDCESFTVISVDSLLVYENKYYLQVYLDNCKIIEL